MPLTKQTISFIEEIMIKYGLEDKLIENDALLKNKISGVEDLSERAVLKLLFGEKIKEQEMAGKSLEDILPSMRLKRILEKLVDKKISYKDLPGLIKSGLSTDQSMTDEIVKLIENNTELHAAINKPVENKIVEEEITEEESAQKIITENKKSIGNELLK
ncbi:MAG: hypothetical protein WC998_00275 [Candidatus Paceibacterota bacterium]|jgi:hypothetical protein